MSEQEEAIRRLIAAARPLAEKAKNYRHYEYEVDALPTFKIGENDPPALTGAVAASAMEGEEYSHTLVGTRALSSGSKRGRWAKRGD
jgi:hypothetical protein